MCRHQAWLGRPRTLADLVLTPPYSLLTQSWAPRRQRYGTVNADGWGIGFFAAGDPQPARWRSARPMWSDTALPSVGRLVSSGCVLAAVRSATEGMPVDESAAAPFLSDGWLFSHNGRVDRRVLPATHLAESTVDSAVLVAHIVEQGVDRLADTVREVGAADPSARLNLLASDGATLVATTWGDTLSMLVTPDGTVLASEPYDDDPRWVDIPDRQLVHVNTDGFTLTPLEPRS